MNATIPDITRLNSPTVLALSRAALALDELVVAGNRAQVKWHETLHDLATACLEIVAADPNYRLPPLAMEALGNDFAEGAMLTCAQKLGWISVADRSEHGYYFRATDDSPVPDILARIEQAAHS